MTNLPDTPECEKGVVGASLVEYALLIGLIALVCVAAMSVLGNRISNFFGSFSNSI